MRKRVRSFIVLSLLFAGTGLLFWNLSSPTKGRVLVLENGEQIVFQGITVGSNTWHCYGNVFQRMAARIPGEIGDKLSDGTRVQAWTYHDTDVTFWFLYRGIQQQLPSFEVRLSDDEGMQANPRFETVESPFTDGAIGFYLNAGILPRRSRTLTLHLSERSKIDGSRRLLGELRMPNPLFKTYPHWIPEELPATRTLGELSVTMEELVVALDSGITNFNRNTEPGNACRFRMSVKESGRPTDNWTYLGARCSDAVGESTYAWYANWKRVQEGRWEIAASWPLWPGEKVAKLQTLWVRREAQPPERTLVLYGVVLPPAQNAATTIVSTNHPLGEIQIVCRPAYASASGERILELVSRDPRFYQYESPEVNCYYFQDARDDRTNQLVRVDARSFRVPLGARTVDVCVHLPEAKRVDFLVSPRLMSVNDPKNVSERQHN